MAQRGERRVNGPEPNRTAHGYADIGQDTSVERGLGDAPATRVTQGWKVPRNDRGWG